MTDQKFLHDGDDDTEYHIAIRRDPPVHLSGTPAEHRRHVQVAADRGGHLRRKVGAFGVAPRIRVVGCGGS